MATLLGIAAKHEIMLGTQGGCLIFSIKFEFQLVTCANWFSAYLHSGELSESNPELTGSHRTVPQEKYPNGNL